MPKHKEKKHHKGEGAKLAGNPEKLISLMITDADKRKHAVDEIVNEGPKHKQVLSALLLNRLYKLVQAIEKNNDGNFSLQKGFDITPSNDEEENILAIPVPINLGTGLDAKKVVEAISKSPEHELLTYAMCLQVVEWGIKASTKNIA